MILKEVDYFLQTDNDLFATTSCYSTSMAMAMDYCLDLAGKRKEDIGCPVYSQLEDYLTKIAQSYETRQWIKRNVSKYGSWMLKYKPRTIAYVQEYIFNSMMKQYGYKSKFSTTITYQEYCKHIRDEKLPVVIHGNFKSVSRVKGHIVCGVGYGDNTLIVHDPYGDALYDKYRSHEKGEFAEYYQYLLTRDWKNKRMWGQLIHGTG